MPALADLDLPEFDVLDPGSGETATHETLHRLAQESWLARSPIAYVVLDREAGELFLRTKSAGFPGNELQEMFGITDGPLAEEMRRNILHLDGEQHRRLRNLVNPFFTPRAADRWRPAMRGFLEELWAPLEGAGRCEAVEQLCKPYPSLTIATVMGAPLSDAPRLHEWSNWIQKQFDAPSLMAERERIDRAVAEFYEWVAPFIEARRSTPGDDLISALIAAESEGDRLSDVECMNLVLNVLVGGVDTTQSQLAHGLRLFAAHPDQWALLAERPELAPQAVGEIVRYEPITPFTARILREDLEVRDVLFPAGDDRHGRRCHREPRRRRGRPPLRHHPRGRRQARADLRRGHPLLPRRQPRARGAAGGARLPRPAHARPRARRRARAGVRAGDLRDVVATPAWDA